MKQDIQELNKEVEDWWNSNPFSFGIGSKEGDQVGAIPLDQMTPEYFEQIERRFRKHSEGAAQDGNDPLFSKLIDFKHWVEGKDVLDIAVGSGFSMVEFVRQGAKSVTGIDLTDFGVQHAKKNLDFRNMDAKVLKMNAQDMTLDNSMFDFVCAWGCYMHMPETQKAINETYRVLRPQGRSLAYMYNKDSWPFWFNSILVKGILMGRLLKYKGNVTKLTSRYADGSSDEGNPMTKFFSKKEVKEMYEKAGFKNVVAEPFRIPDEPNHWPLRKAPIFRYILPKRIKKYMTKWGYGLIVIGEK